MTAHADRAKVLERSLEKFFHPPGTCWVVVSDGDAEAIAKRFSSPTYEFVQESELLP